MLPLLSLFYTPETTKCWNLSSSPSLHYIYFFLFRFSSSLGGLMTRAHFILRSGISIPPSSPHFYGRPSMFFHLPPPLSLSLLSLLPSLAFPCRCCRERRGGDSEVGTRFHFAVVVGATRDVKCRPQKQCWFISTHGPSYFTACSPHLTDCFRVGIRSREKKICIFEAGKKATA